MNAPFIWAILPLILAGGLFFLQRWQRISVILGILFTLLLAALSLWHPIGELVNIGPISYQINSTLSIFSRRLILEESDRPILTLTYLMTAFWFGGAYISRAGKLFISVGFVIVALLTAAMAVEPFLYAALIIELVVLVSVPLLSPPGQPLVRGVLRFIAFQSIGMPFILFLGWMLAGVETSPGNFEMVTKAMVMMGLGFAFLLGIFPFHTWIPVLSDQVHPYVFSFVLFTLSWMVSLLGLSFFNRYVWMRDSDSIYSMLRMIGVIMIGAGGVWAAFQSSLPRIMGYAVMVEIGFMLLTISMPAYLPMYFTMVLPRLISFGVWSLSLSSIRTFETQINPTSLTISNLRGIGRYAPIATSGIVIANLSLAGFPLLAAFPIRLAMLQGLSEISAIPAILCLFGCVGLMISALRSLELFSFPIEHQTWETSERRVVLLYLGIGILVLLLIGIFPQWFLPPLTNLTAAFGQLLP